MCAVICYHARFITLDDLELAVGGHVTYFMVITSQIVLRVTRMSAKHVSDVRF